MAATDLLTLSEARDALNLSATATDDDAEIWSIYIPAITPVVEDIVGPVVQRSVTYTTDGGKTSILLPHSGLVSLDSITIDGVAQVASKDYTANLSVGVIRPVWSWFGGGNGSVTVTYTAGIAASTETVPAAIKLAARLILANLWQGDQQGYRPEFGTPGDDASMQTPSGFAVPRQAYALLEPFAVSSVGIG